MDRKETELYIADTYAAAPEHPWARYPGYTVYRHHGNQKWFALILEIPKEKLGLPGSGAVAVMNVKCEPLMIGPLRAEPGFFPAYHMNKESWLTVALDGSVDSEKIKLLLDMSFRLTAPRPRRRKPPEQAAF